MFFHKCRLEFVELALQILLAAFHPDIPARARAHACACVRVHVRARVGCMCMCVCVCVCVVAKGNNTFGVALSILGSNTQNLTWQRAGELRGELGDGTPTTLTSKVYKHKACSPRRQLKKSQKIK